MAIKYYDSPFHVTESPEVAAQLVLKTNLMVLIRDIIEDRGWTQGEAAIFFNEKGISINQPRISKIMNGKIDRFTLDILVTLLEALGFAFKFEAPKIKNKTKTQNIPKAKIQREYNIGIRKVA